MSTIFDDALRALDNVDATLESRCAHCEEPIPPSSPSAYYCGPDCQTVWAEVRARDPDSARGSCFTYPDQMRWAPNMVTGEPDDPDLVPDPDPPAELRYQGTGIFTGTVYRRRGRPGIHLRLDDGYRFVGRDLPTEGQPDTVWRSLERQLVDERLVERIAHPDTASGLSALRAAAATVTGGLAALRRASSPNQSYHADPAPADSLLDDICEYAARSAHAPWPQYRWCPNCLRRSRVRVPEPELRTFRDPGPTVTRRGYQSCGECEALLPAFTGEIARVAGGMRYALTLVRWDRLTLHLPSTSPPIADGAVLGYIEGRIVTRAAAMHLFGESHRAAAAWRWLMSTTQP